MTGFVGGGTTITPTRTSGPSGGTGHAINFVSGKAFWRGVFAFARSMGCSCATAQLSMSGRRDTRCCPRRIRSVWHSCCPSPGAAQVRGHSWAKEAVGLFEQKAAQGQASFPWTVSHALERLFPWRPAGLDLRVPRLAFPENRQSAQPCEKQR